ncbi:response regulator [Botrimarina sp.]|uniref:response regulator n=1 Tax=Botrimarina sp. TaxID=2795802 RepID=UPI0032EEADC6
MEDRSPRVLIADDNAALRRVIGFTFTGAGYEAVSVNDGAAALEAAGLESFDLIVTDQQMPRMSGLELIERLRETPLNADTPVVLLTAKGLELEFGPLRKRLGVAAMVAKPFSPTELTAVADRLIAQPQ